MNHNNAIRVLYGQNGRMMRISSIDNETLNESGAPKHYKIEVDDGVELFETYTPGQRNLVLEAVL